MSKPCYIIDTGVISSVLSGNNHVIGQIERLGIEMKDFSITLPIKAEILNWIHSLRGHIDPQIRISRGMFVKLINMVEDIDVVPIVDLTGIIAQYYFSDAFKFGFNDLINASCAIERECFFLTKNKKHYSVYTDSEEANSLKLVVIN